MKETEFMMNVGTRRNRGGILVAALVAAVLAGCATAAVNGDPGVAGERPRDDANTRAASVALAQAALSEGEAARANYETSLAAALRAIEADPTNPRAYLLAGQASVGVGQWVRADTMFARAEQLNPRYADQIVAERDEAWVLAYSLGVEAMNAGDYDTALDRFRGADLLFQARPEARIALGILHSQLGDTDAAVAAYRGALDILERPAPDWLSDEQVAAWAEDRQATTLTLANLLGQAGRFGEAAEVLSRYLDQPAGTLDPEQRLQAMTARAAFLAQAGRTEEAEALYEELLTEGELGANEYFQIGIGLFNAGEYVRAADAFANSARMNPYSRDAHLNLVQALYTAALDVEEEPASPARNQRLREHYTQLLEAADHVAELDPLNRNLLSFRLRAYRSLADISDGATARGYTQTIQEVFREYQQQEYEVSDIAMALTAQNRAVVQGYLTNLSGTAGSSVGLRFTMLDVDGNVIDTSTAQVTVPALNESVEFSTEVDLTRGLLAGWRYELVR
jgi:tetratricopeptide (TPR) repeat protein